MTNTGRESVALILVAVQLMFFMGLGGIATLVVEDLTGGGGGSTAANESEEDEDSSLYLALLLGIVNIYVVSIISFVAKTILLIMYKMAAQQGGNMSKVLSVLSGIFFGSVIMTTVGQLTFLSCADFRANVLLPLLMKQPLSLLLAPLTFTVLSTIGTGPGVTEMLELWSRVDGLAIDPLRQHLKQMGMGPYLRGAPKWDLEKINGASVSELKGNKETEFDGDAAEGNTLLDNNGISSKKDWSVDEMKALLKEALYVAAVSEIYNKIDALTEGGLLFEKWERIQYADSEFAMDRARVLSAIKGSIKIVELNEFYPWTVTLADLSAVLAAGTSKDEEAQPEHPIPDADLRCTLKEIEWVKLTTVPHMWGLVQADGSVAMAAAGSSVQNALREQAPEVSDVQQSDTLVNSVENTTMAS